MDIHSNSPNAHRDTSCLPSTEQHEISNQNHQAELIPQAVGQAAVDTASETTFHHVLHYARQQCQMEIKRYDRRKRLERTATLLCLWFQFICVAWIQLIQPSLNHFKESRQTGRLPEGVVQPQKHIPQDPFHRSGTLQNCITLHNPSSGLQTSGFGLRKHPLTGQLKMHNGIDFSAGQGNPIRAAAAGVVTQVGDVEDGYGLRVLIRHPLQGIKSLETLYAHLDQAHVQPEDLVSRGQIIGSEGSTGLTTEPNLHFEVRLDGVPTNPADFIDQSWGQPC